MECGAKILAANNEAKVKHTSPMFPVPTHKHQTARMQCYTVESDGWTSPCLTLKIITLYHPFSEHFCNPHGEYGSLHAKSLQHQNLVSVIVHTPVHSWFMTKPVFCYAHFMWFLLVYRFVIELCEPIQVKQLDIANFELFSSTPKDFLVSISDRYFNFV